MGEVAVATCDNCSTRTPASGLDEITDYHQRVEAGGEVPAGQCPECGALAYLEVTGG